MQDYVSHKRTIVVLFCLFVFNAILFCQGLTSIASVDGVAKFEAIPNDLAFDMLGLPGNAIQQPGTVSKFLASISQAADRQGHLSTGIAITFAPYQLIKAGDLKPSDYINEYVKRLLSNIQLSLGTAPSQEADSSLDWGMGMRIVFFNTGDGRLDSMSYEPYIQRAKAILHTAILPPPGEKISKEILELNADALSLGLRANNNILTSETPIDQLQDTIKVIAAAFGKLASRYDTLGYRDKAEAVRSYADLLAVKKGIRENKQSASWNTSSLDLNIGTVYRTAHSLIQKSAFSKTRAWINGGIGLGFAQLLGQVGYYRQFAFPGQPDSTFYTTAIMLRGGNQDFRVGIGSNARNFDNGGLDLVAEIRLSSKMWVIASLNRAFSKDVTPIWAPGITIKTTGGALGF